MDDSELDDALFFDDVPGAYPIRRAFKDAVMTAVLKARLRVQKTWICPLCGFSRTGGILSVARFCRIGFDGPLPFGL